MTPSTRPVTRITSAYARDRGLRQVIVTITGGLIELRLKGLRSIETLEVSALYHQAVRQRVIAEKAARKAERKTRSKRTT